MTTLFNEFDYLLEPNQNPNNISGTFTGTDGKTYSREYSFVDRPFDYSSLREQQLNIRNDILDYKNNEEIYTKAQTYANKVRGRWVHRNKTFAVEGNRNSASNPNTKNYIRVDANKNIINETTKHVIPNTDTSLPYNNQIRKDTVYTTQDMTYLRYNLNKPDMTDIVIPIVQNDPMPVEEEIVEGGVLYSCTNFNNPTHRDKIDVSLYRFSEQAIVSNEFAKKFNIDVGQTYDKEELENITGKTFLELYPDYPSWSQQQFQGSVVSFTSADGMPGDFLPSMYNSTTYIYDSSTNQFIDEYIRINMFVPLGSNVYNANNTSGTEVDQTVKIHTFDFKEPPIDQYPRIELNGNGIVYVYQGASYTDSGAQAYDVQDGIITGSIQTTSNVNTAVIGSYLVVYSVTDSNGNSSSSTRIVHVIADPHVPVIILNGNSTMSVQQNSTFSDPGATANDWDGSDITSSIQVTGSVNTAVLESYLLTYRVTNTRGNSSTATRTVIVSTDSVNPVITLNGNSTMSIVQNTTFTDPGATATDNVDGNITNRIQTSGTVNTSVVGTYLIQYSVSDTAGNSSSVTRTVYVVAAASTPVITLLGPNNGSPIYVNFDVSFSDPGATASDTVDGNLTSSIVVSGTVDTEKIGTQTLTYTVTNSSGNSSSVQRQVIVVDVTSPSLNLNGPNPLYMNVNTAYVEPGWIAYDDVDGNVGSSVQVVNNVITTVVGQYTVEYSVTDTAGNTPTTATRIVNVV